MVALIQVGVEGPFRRYWILPAAPEPASVAVTVTVTSVLLQVVGALSETVGPLVSMRTVQVPVSLARPLLSRARYW